MRFEEKIQQIEQFLGGGVEIEKLLYGARDCTQKNCLCIRAY